MSAEVLSAGNKAAGNKAAGRIVCADNLAFLGTLADASVHLVVTSPPYNIGKSYEKRARYERRAPLDAYLAEQAAVIAECVRVLHPRGSLCWQVGNHVLGSEIVPLDTVLYPVFKALDLRLRNRIVWHYEHGLHCSKRLSGRYETINWFTRSDDFTFNLDAVRVPQKYPGKKHFKGPNTGQFSGHPLGKNPGDVWIFPNVKSNHVEKTSHPCQFPVELVERLVLALTEPGVTVFDPYAGVGSTVIAAVKQGRIGLGCEIVPDYVEIARERLASLAAGTLRTRPMERPVLQPREKPPS